MFDSRDLLSVFPHARRHEGSADDGQRSERLDVCSCFSERRKKERVWERNGLAVGPGRRLADFLFGVVLRP